ncbi:MAG: DUF4920 domain-containing protein [Polyangiales bacterium]
MNGKNLLVLGFLGLAACAPQESSEALPAPSEAPAETVAAENTPEEAAPANPAAEAEQTVFGAGVTDRELTPLSDLTGAPERFDGQVIKTEGEITAVCQRMGCWMEMRSEEGAPTVRVPLAGHDYFLPRDVSGRHATIEGQVAIRALSDAEREHLASEGAQAVATALQVSATGVVLSDPS